MAEKARFISRYGDYSVGVQSFSPERLGHQGEMVPVKPRIDAQFHRSLVTDDDFAIALQSFHFPGLPFDEERNQNVSPRYRVSVWDSEWARENEGFSEDEISLIISKLRSDPGLGVDHIEVAAVRAKEPIPNYDTLSIDDILTIVKLANVDPETVVAYERENADRQELIDELLGVTAGDDAVVVQA